MNRIHLLPLFLTALFFVACSGGAPEPSGAEVPATEAPTVRADADEHGCKGSAGYTWSVLRNECIRLFEAGVRLDPQDPSLDKSLSAFLVFKTTDIADDAKLEVYLPGEKASRVFDKQPQSPEGDAGTWKGGDLTINYWKGMYMLEDANKKVLYQGMWDNH